ncbi:MAG: fructosamine kinase family protein, partial [Bacteroidota bacterium]
LERNNYIGSLPQTNTPRPDWTSFFIEQRLEAQCRMARDAGAIGPELLRAFDRAFHRLDGFFPEEPAALLHGDLWMGNFLCTSDGKPMLIDPAVYGGHREMDLAMTRLFGGFAPAFYQSYADTYPLENGWEERVPIANLYPLMVHVNLFGGHYVQQVAQCLRRFA